MDEENPSAESFVDSNSVEEWCRTECKEVSFSYLWTISNYSILQKKIGECVYSSVLTIGPPQKQSRWYLELYPNGYNEKDQDFVAMYLTLQDIKGDLSESVFVSNSTFAIVDSQGRKVNVENDEVGQHFSAEETSGYNRFVKRSLLLSKTDGERLLVNDELSLFCSLKIVTDWVVQDGRAVVDRGEVCREMFHFVKTLVESVAGDLEMEDVNKGDDNTFVGELNVDNAVNMLANPSKNSKAQVIAFIVDNFTEVKKTHGWQNAMTEHPERVVDVFDAIVERLFPKRLKRTMIHF